jgi:hypothetical protein
MVARQIAETVVKIGRILSNNGRIIPIAPKISEMPMKRIKGRGKPSTPVCPLATNFCSEKMDLFIPENIKTNAISDCRIQRVVFMIVI